MLRSPISFLVPLSLVAALAVPLASRPASAAGDIPDQTTAETRALSTANPTVLSNPDFTDNPDLAGTAGSHGGAVGSGGDGTENYPPGATGPEATGSTANGSMMGGFGS